ncbi:MAG: DEAD/DEAH box helicase, partial [Acidobacteriota bacterium]
MAAPDSHDTVGPDDALEPFHPLVQAWFREEVGTPTEAQALAWPRIAGGEHVLVSAPTGSGKTLTAFLWALDRLLTGAWPGDRLRVLYISPLRALNTDVRRNLQKPLEALKRRFAAAGTPAARVQVMTRSGDTPQAERRKMLRHPPEILVTTPESLNILLTSRSGRNLLGDVRCVILDEIHFLDDRDRGTVWEEVLIYLPKAVQVVGLSATLSNLHDFAAWLEEVRERKVVTVIENKRSVPLT